MTQEEKAKAYDIALDKIKRLLGTGSNCSREELEYVFPELKESEDERIRKELIDFVKSRLAGFPDCKRFTDWLERQGEHANFRNKIQIGDKVTKNRDGYLVNLSQLNRVAKVEENQGEQKPAGNVEPKFKKGDRVIGIISGMQYYITEVCNDYYYTESGCIIMFCAQDNFNLYEQKPAWSEEDNRILSTLTKYLEEHGGGIDGWECSFLSKWLKSLRPQNRWKPSDEQMMALKEAVDAEIVEVEDDSNSMYAYTHLEIYTDEDLSKICKAGDKAKVIIIKQK